MKEFKAPAQIAESVKNGNPEVYLASDGTVYILANRPWGDYTRVAIFGHVAGKTEHSVLYDEATCWSTHDERFLQAAKVFTELVNADRQRSGATTASKKTQVVLRVDRDRQTLADTTAILTTYLREDPEIDLWFEKNFEITHAFHLNIPRHHPHFVASVKRLQEKMGTKKLPWYIVEIESEMYSIDFDADSGTEEIITEDPRDINVNDITI